MAIAKVAQATHIYSDDRDIRAIANREGIQVIGLADLELPIETAQRTLNLQPPELEITSSEEIEARDEEPPQDTPKA